MIDPDPAVPVLRLGDASARKAPSVEDATKRLTVAEHEMEQAIKRWSAAYVDWTAMRAQAQPVAASRPIPDGMMRYEPAPLVYRVDGRVERL